MSHLSSDDHVPWDSSQQGKRLASPNEQAQEAVLQSLLIDCQRLAQQYQTTPEIVQSRAWWKSLHEAGVRLRDILEETRPYQHRLSLTSKELEEAYLTLIHVAYFFEPGGIAEATFQEQKWTWPADEQEPEREETVAQGVSGW